MASITIFSPRHLYFQHSAFFFFSVTSHCRKRLFCGALVISLCHLMVESWVGLNSVLEMNWSSTCVTRKLLPPLSTDLAACPSMESPYCVSAIRYPSNKRAHTHTHTLSMWHTFCAYFHWHTQHIRTLSLRPAPPTPTHSYQSQRVLCAFTDWLGSYWRERARLVGGGRWRQQDTEILEREADR